MKDVTFVPLPPTQQSTRIRRESAATHKRPAPVNMTDEKVDEEFKVDGLPGVCAFRASMHDTCIRVSTPELSRRLSKLAGAKLVRDGVAGPYLKVWEVPHPMSWAKLYMRKLAKEGVKAATGTITDAESVSMPA